MNPITLVDTSLRDGSHAMRHQFTAEQVRAVVTALDSAGVPIIEVSHGDGLGGSSVQYGFSRTNELELIEAARAAARQARIAALLVPGIGTRKELKPAVERGLQVVRIATQCTEADVSEQHFGIAKELGLEAYGFLMMAHMRPPEVLVEQALLMESYGADGVYIVDSAGAMLPEDAAARVGALKQALKVRVGFHAHNNLDLALGNTLAAIDAGATLIDGSLAGLGAGAGNARLEIVAAVLDKQGRNPGVDVFALLEAAQEVTRPIMPYEPVPNRDAAVIGYAGVYSTFLLHAKRAAEQFGVRAVDILVELARRQAVAGQEDWILDVAVELAARKKQAG